MLQHVALYCRGSYHCREVGQQLEDLRWWCKEYSAGQKVHEYIDDHGAGGRISRGNPNPPARTQLTSDVAVGLVSTLVVARLDRLGFDVTALTEFCAELRQRQVRCVAIHDGIDTDSGDGRLVLNAIATLAVHADEVRKEDKLESRSNTLAHARTRYSEAQIEELCQGVPSFDNIPYRL